MIERPRKNKRTGDDCGAEDCDHFRLRLEEVSSRLVSVGHGEMDDAIKTSLERVAIDYGFDRASLWRMNVETELAYRFHEWVADEQFASDDTVFEYSDAPWLSNKVLCGAEGLIVIPDELPPDALADRNYYEERGVKSSVVVPIGIDGVLSGVVGLSSLRQERSWTSNEKMELNVLMHLIATAWLRRDKERKLREREKHLLRSQRVASVGSYSLYMRDGSPIVSKNAVLRHSSQANAIFGIADGQESLALLSQLVHPDDLKRTRDEMLQAARSEQNSFEMAYRVLRRCADNNETETETVYVEDRIEFDRDKNGRIRRLFGTVQDVTARVKIERELRDALADADKLRDQLQAENQLLKEEARASKVFETIVGTSEALRSALTAVRRVATTDVTVLILGETGTGKELIARSIHELSERSAAPLISVNCAALSSELMESELFGHEQGAFTGAQQQRKGRFELAHQGTLFLDEVGDLPLDVQAKLLRVLQSGEFERVGGSRTLSVDVRVIAATNRKLRAMVHRGEFRADLFFRINSFPVELPPLRERRSDIPLLANYFLEKYADSLGKNIRVISDDMLQYMSGLPWPGNVRELEGYIQRALISTSGPELEFIETESRYDSKAENGDAANDGATEAVVHSETDDLESMQRKHIRGALVSCNWVIDGENGAAAALGIPASSLRSRMKRLGISRPH